ncbi:MAG: hypothetical protein QXN68_00500 [Thermoplasmata archaeon]
MKHYTLLKAFNDYMFKNCVDFSVLKEEVVVEDEAYWFFEMNKSKYLLPIDQIENIPFRILETKQIKYKGKVFYVVTKLNRLKILPEKLMSFRDLVNWFELRMSEYDGDRKLKMEEYELSKIHNLLYRIIVLTAAISRINARISSNPGFGKNSMSNMLGLLLGDVVDVVPRTAAAIEFRLLNKLVVLDEMSNLESNQRQLIQNLLLQIGDFSTTYQRGARGVQDTYDVYDISKLSLLIFYNRYEDYLAVGQANKYFDNVFTKAVQDRFPPFKFYGVLDNKQFLIEPNHSDFVKYVDVYKAVMKTIHYYRQNYRDEILVYQQDVDDFLSGYVLKGTRHMKSLKEILSFIRLYSLGIDEFERLATNLMDAYFAYYKENDEVAVVEEIPINRFL